MLTLVSANGTPIPMAALLFVENCYRGQKWPLHSLLLFQRAERLSFFPAMTSSFFKDQLLSIVAAFIVEGEPGDELLLPSMAALRKRADGRLMMGRNGTFWTCFNETSDDIVAKIERWNKELLGA